MKQEFLDLGMQPLANGFLTKDATDEFRFRLAAGFDPDTSLVSLMEFVDKPMLFNDSYPYYSSGSATMRKHFSDIAGCLLRNMLLSDESAVVLEIGSNDGVFLQHWPSCRAIAVEPCQNFARYTQSLGYRTYNRFWDCETADTIRKDYDGVDIIYSANCMCHIPDIDNAFKAVADVLVDDGVFVFEDPSLADVICNNSYDQIYDEHAHLFSVLALDKLLRKHGLVIVDVEHLSVHGGSNRIWAKKSDDQCLTNGIEAALKYEKSLGLDKLETFTEFASRVRKSKDDLITLLGKLHDKGRIIGYGATSKSTVVYNYCEIGTDIIDYVTDTTPVKQGLVTPGTHIPIVPPNGLEGVDFAFLGAWNFKDEIVNKEAGFVKRGGRFVAHVPNVGLVL